MKRYIIIVIMLILLISCNDENAIISKQNEAAKPVVDEIIIYEDDHNHLGNETSPYLLQHATNPINWYPYSEEALQRAKDENKLIFLSIGYSTCHWCHVMASESFENIDLAKVLNDNYIAIKVDREERPDIDSYYMNLFQQAGGTGGWPLNVILTPEQQMFFGLTYMPKDSVGGRPGLIDTLTYLEDMWVNETEKVLDTAESIARISDQLESVAEGTFDNTLNESILENFNQSFDTEYGGFSIEGKFTSPHYLDYLLKQDNAKARQMVFKTLDNIIKGGINDHLAGGFHRYTIDQKWQVPHFEKMLYDQAQLISVLGNAYEINSSDSYKENIYGIIDFVDSRLSNGSLYYAAIDADSEHEEGRHYIWTIDEVKTILTEKEFRFAEVYYNLSERGNYLDEVTNDYTGHNILYVTSNESVIDLTDEEIKTINNKLLLKRDERVFPHIDEKILTDWNAMYIYSLLQVSDQLNDLSLQEKALNSLHILEGKLIVNDGNFIIYHSMIDNQVAYEGFLDDYAYLLKAYLISYELTYDINYLDKAIELADAGINKFWSETNNGFMYSDVTTETITNEKKFVDTAYPTGYTTFIQGLKTLGDITANPTYYDLSSRASNSIAGLVNMSPFISLGTVELVNSLNETHYEIVIVEGSEPVDAYLEVLADIDLEHLTVIVKTAKNADQLKNIAAYTEYYTAMNDKTTVFICKNATCQLPLSGLNDFKEAVKQLSN